eukprot:scaffold260_cov274-Pinguiococcus_pyrenoidosus.AAC.32
MRTKQHGSEAAHLALKLHPVLHGICSETPSSVLITQRILGDRGRSLRRARCLEGGVTLLALGLLQGNQVHGRDCRELWSGTVNRIPWAGVLPSASKVLECYSMW